MAQNYRFCIHLVRKIKVQEMYHAWHMLLIKTWQSEVGVTVIQLSRGAK